MRNLIAAALALACVMLAIPARAADLADVAARYENTNPTGWSHAWCARFIRMILPQAGLAAPQANDLSNSFLSLPRTRAHRGAIVVLAGHVGIVERVDRVGVHMISGNWGHRVGRGIVSPSSVQAYVEPQPASAAASIPWPIKPAHARHHRHYRPHHRRRAHVHHR